MKRVALVGTGGMLGRDLLKGMKSSYTVIPVAGSQDLDIRQRSRVLRWIKEAKPDILINAASYTDVDGCEGDRRLAMEVNGEGPGHLAEGCSRMGARMVQISTDFVFDGAGRAAYRETDMPRPISVYGESKLLGERRVLENLDKTLIVRTSWLYGAGGKNFVEAILRQAVEKKRLRVVNDQVGSPTYVPDLTIAIIRLLQADAHGVVHVSNTGECSWFNFAEKILELSGLSVPVEPISSAELNRPARRPAYSALCCERYYRICGESMRPWEDGLRDYIKKRGNKE
jgi:dTDP-4-dehydrorhamnose reductase